MKVRSFGHQLFGLPVSSCYGCELLSVTCLGFDSALLFFWFPPLRGARCPQSRARPPGGAAAKAAECSNPEGLLVLESSRAAYGTVERPLRRLPGKALPPLPGDDDPANSTT